ncbi:RING finger protein 11 [Chelonia mydas]|uniref:RING finger protein 11 n=1 Tax=Chelonia mydas TaxID=8469 RepID=M7BZK8_CHEMY|nr:RING finger protein 11 [Chelonia mydas]
MGNCLKSPTSDDISLLHESQSDRASYGDGTEPDQEPPPPYQVIKTNGDQFQRDEKEMEWMKKLRICGSWEIVLFLQGSEQQNVMTLPEASTCSVHLLILDTHSNYQEQVPVPVYHPTPSQTRLATQLTEEEQIRIAQRIGLIQHLPKGVYDPGRDGSEKKIRECVICMMDFVYGDPIRFLPCMHIYHLDCIDDWLMRSFTCPSCMEPVDAALLSSYETN